MPRALSESAPALRQPLPNRVLAYVLFVLTALFGLLMGVAPAAGQEVSGHERASAAHRAPTLELGAFLDRVLRSHPDVDAIRLEDDRAAAALMEARGGFDPTLETGYEYKTQEDKDKLNVLKSGLALPFNAPLSPSLTLDYKRGLGSSVDPSVATATSGEARFGVSVSPLRGLMTDKKRTAMATARLEPRRANAIQRSLQNDLLLDATLAYWTWVEAQQLLRIQQDLFELASRRYELITRRARAGEEAPIDSVEAELAAVSREGKVADAIRKAEQTRAKLSVFLWDDGGPASEVFETYAAPEPAEDVPVDTSRAMAFRVALANRPELRELDVKQQQIQLKRRLARAQIRPDLKFEVQAVSYDQTDVQVDDVKVGFKIDQPLFFRGSRSEEDEAIIEVRQIDIKRQVTERKIEADVEAAVVGVRQARERVRLSERRVELARRLLAAESRRFELGESTLFVLNQREQSFAEAREEALSARIALHRAAAEYRWATGTIANDLPVVF
jgi:outer membrane protein TolC